MLPSASIALLCLALPGANSAAWRKPLLSRPTRATAGFAGTRRSIMAPSAHSEPVDECISAAQGMTEVVECLLPFTQHPANVLDDGMVFDGCLAASTDITSADRLAMLYGAASNLRECLAEADCADAVTACVLDYDELSA
jgi:hypothetical protein